MIQIYSPGNTNFKQNGDMTLFPEICEASSELGGAWTLEITHPIDNEGRWKYIEKESVLSVPTHMGEDQLYRIDEITDKNDADISAKAYPIFYDSAKEVFLMDKRPTAKNGQEALDILTEGTKYSGESNIFAANTAYFVRRNLLDCILGDKSPSFVGVWGGEVLFDNFKVIVNERAGGDYGAEVRYGKNMVGVNVSEDMSDVVTRIVPVAYNGRLLTSQMVDSPLINNYAIPYTKEIKFEDVRYFEDIDENTDTTDLIVCNSQEELDAALITKCNEQFELGIDLFKATIKVDMVALENTEEYKDFKDLVKIGLGDDVSCYHTRLKIETKARAIKVVWDCITNSVKNVILGDYQYDFLKKFNSAMEKVENVLNEDGSVMAEKVQGVLNAMNTQLRYQKSIAQKQDVRAMLFEDLDLNSPTYGAMCYGTQGFQISKKRTADGRDWVWSTAFTAQGGYADVIIAGILSDKTARNYWNLNTGELKMGHGSISLGDLFNADSSGNVVANSLKSKNATITGGEITIEGLADSTFPIVFKDKVGRRIKIGPTWVWLEDDNENTFYHASAGNVEIGEKSGDGTYNPKAGMMYNGMLTSKYAYNTTTSDGANVVVTSNGLFRRSSSSSEKYKVDITDNIDETLNPRRLYDLPVKMFKYKDGYLAKNDRKNGKNVIGFIVEEMEQVYDAAVQYVEGMPEMWNANILIPAMLKLIQEQNERIKKLEGLYD